MIYAIVGIDCRVQKLFAKTVKDLGQKIASRNPYRDANVALIVVVY